MRCVIVTWQQHATSCVTPGLLDSHMTGWSRTGVFVCLCGGLGVDDPGIEAQIKVRTCNVTVSCSVHVHGGVLSSCVSVLFGNPNRWNTQMTHVLESYPHLPVFHLITPLLYTLIDQKPGLLKSFFFFYLLSCGLSSFRGLFLSSFLCLACSLFSLPHLLFVVFPPLLNMSAICLKALLKWLSCFSLKMSARGSGM